MGQNLSSNSKYVSQSVLCTAKNRTRPHSSPKSTIKPENLTPETLASRLKQCAKTKNIEHGKLLHSYIKTSKHVQNTFVMNFVVYMYGSCGSLVEAQNVFHDIKKPNIHSWNIFINTCVKCGYAQEACHAFTQMQNKGFEANISTYTAMIDACACLTNIEMGHIIHTAVIESQFEDNPIVGTAFMKMYGQCATLFDVKNVFNRMPLLDVVTWSSMIGKYNKYGYCNVAWGLYHRMQHECIVPDQVACICIIDSCTNLKNVNKGQQVHILVIENEYINDIVVGTSLLNLYAKCGRVDKAFKVFAEVPHKNLVSWNSMIGSYASNGLTAEALSLFHQMQVEGFCPDKTTFISVINALNDMTVVNDGRRLHAILSSHVDVVFQTAIVNAYGKCGSLSDAITLFHKMAHRDVVTWCAIITACIQNGRDKDAIKFFCQMHHNATDVDEAIFACMLDVCGRLSLLDKGQELHSAIIENGCENDITVGTALINMYGKCGSSSDSKFVFTKLQNRNMVTWSSMIGSYAHNGQGKEAIELFQQMQNEQIMPNEVTFHSILTACSHTGKIGDGVNYLTLLSQMEGLPQREEYILSMIDLLGRAGHLAEAETLINGLSPEKKPIAWSCLMACCRLHGDIERGTCLANHIFDIDPLNAAAYVSIYNLYAVASVGKEESIC